MIHLFVQQPCAFWALLYPGHWNSFKQVRSRATRGRKLCTEIIPGNYLDNNVSKRFPYNLKHSPCLRITFWKPWIMEKNAGNSPSFILLCTRSFVAPFFRLNFQIFFLPGENAPSLNSYFCAESTLTIWKRTLIGAAPFLKRLTVEW